MFGEYRLKRFETRTKKLFTVDFHLKQTDTDKHCNYNALLTSLLH